MLEVFVNDKKIEDDRHIYIKGLFDFICNEKPFDQIEVLNKNILKSCNYQTTKIIGTHELEFFGKVGSNTYEYELRNNEEKVIHEKLFANNIRVFERYDNLARIYDKNINSIQYASPIDKMIISFVGDASKISTFKTIAMDFHAIRGNFYE